MGARTPIAAADLILRLPFVACNTQNVEKRALRRPDARLHHQHFSTIRSFFAFRFREDLLPWQRIRRNLGKLTSIVAQPFVEQGVDPPLGLRMLLREGPCSSPSPLHLLEVPSLEGRV